MGYIYRWTISYYATGLHGTPLGEYEYYYNVRTRRRLSRARYFRIEKSLRRRSRGHLSRYHKKLKESGGKIEKGKILERTSLEKPRGSRSRKERIESKALRMKVKDGRAIPTDLYDKKRMKGDKEDTAQFRKRVTTKEYALPKPLSRKEKHRRKMTR